MKKSKVSIVTCSVFFLSIVFSIYSCSSGGKETKVPAGTETTVKKEDAPSPKGIGEIKHVDISGPLNDQMITRGKGIYDMKCSACHKVTNEKLVGPGWAG
ncbi:MAG: cytochrome c, partial [Bacteroidia bacterium]